MNQIYKAFLASSKLEVASSRHCIFSNSSLVRSLSRSTKIAIVGSGPAGFYATQHLLNHGGCNTTVDIYERLPVPFGLVRYGVAPDHPEVKNVENTFTTTAENERVNFLGNVAVGKDIKIKELLEAYHAVILAYGAANDRTLDIPGENLSNVVSARSFVGFYNGLPEASYLKEKVCLNSHDTAVIVGLGNVALDVARILLTPVDILRKTDITEEALEMLNQSTIKNVYIVGRRGPLHVSFTIKELREMVNLEGARPNFKTSDYHGLTDVIPTLVRPRKRLTELLVKSALGTPNEKQEILWSKGSRNWFLKLLRTPIEITSADGNTVSGIKLGINELVPKGNCDENQHVADTGVTETIDCGLVLRSIGYKSIAVEKGIPYDEKRGLIPNENGKIIGFPGLFCAGWLATGPKGVIVNTMTEAFKVGQTVIENLPELLTKDKDGYDRAVKILKERNVEHVTFQDWKKIDSREKSLGKAVGKPREKITNVKEMVSGLQQKRNGD